MAVKPTANIRYRAPTTTYEPGKPIPLPIAMPRGTQLTSVVNGPLVATTRATTIGQLSEVVPRSECRSTSALVDAPAVFIRSMLRASPHRSRFRHRPEAASGQHQLLRQQSRRLMDISFDTTPPIQNHRGAAF